MVGVLRGLGLTVLPGAVSVAVRWRDLFSVTSKQSVTIPLGFSMTYDNSTEQTVFGWNNFAQYSNVTDGFFVSLPSDPLQLNNYTCMYTIQPERFAVWKVCGRLWPSCVFLHIPLH